MMNDLEIAFTAKEITAYGGVSLLYKMFDNCHFKEALSSVGLPQQGSNRGKTSGLPKPATPLLSWRTTSSVSSGMLSSIPRRVISLRPSGTRYSVFLPISKRREIKMFYVL